MLLHVRQPHIRPAGMEVGDHGDGKLAARGQDGSDGA